MVRNSYVQRNFNFFFNETFEAEFEVENGRK